VIVDGVVKHDHRAASLSMQPFSFDLAGRVQRSPIFGRQVVATSSPAAAQVGLRVMEHGGNAIDAAVAVAATLSVVEPTMNGVGGDLFALVWDGGELHGLNASGRSPRAWSLERFAARGAIPELGWDAVTVPGAVSGWVALCARFGTQPFAELLAPAIGYARDGFPVLPRMAALWAEAPARYADFAEFRRVFLPGGRAPRAGEPFRLPDLARSLEQIAETRGAALYGGELGARMAQAAREAGGALTLDDLEQHRASFVSPISVDFHGARVCEPPPNGQGLAALIALGILRHLPLGRLGPEHHDAVHFQIEAMKLAFADCARHVADPARMRISTDELLSEARLAQLAEQVSASRAALPLPGPRPDHGTVYATTADREGRMVSLIQSNYLGFGSGVVVPSTGISLQNRGLGFSLDPDHPNRVAGGALPYHTIMPGMLLEGGQARMSFGVMGGHMQPQGHVQLVLRTRVFGQDPQAACDAPRWYLAPDGRVALEPELAAAVGSGLLARGHTLLPSPPTLLFGGAQVIYKLGSFYCAGSDPRKDGQAVGC
jgi:gamma-glutamyltranspeptidase/glutathione hydrolase